MDIAILGPGCRNCQALESRTREALQALELEATIDKVTDPVAIAGHGIMSTPGLVIDGVVVSAGTVPSARRLQAILAAAQAG